MLRSTGSVGVRADIYAKAYTLVRTVSLTFNEFRLPPNDLGAGAEGAVSASGSELGRAQPGHPTDPAPSAGSDPLDPIRGRQKAPEALNERTNERASFGRPLGADRRLRRLKLFHIQSLRFHNKKG